MSFSNGLTDAEAEMLDILQEEAAELIQAVGKIKRHGMNSVYPDTGVTNKKQLEIELGDVGHIVARLAGLGVIDMDEIVAAEAAKAQRIGQYLHHN